MCAPYHRCLFDFAKRNKKLLDSKQKNRRKWHSHGFLSGERRNIPKKHTHKKLSSSFSVHSIQKWEEMKKDKSNFILFLFSVFLVRRQMCFFFLFRLLLRSLVTWVFYTHNLVLSLSPSSISTIQMHTYTRNKNHIFKM